MQQPTTRTRFVPVKDWPNYHPWPTVAGLRHLIFNAHENGFERCIRRVGRRVLLDEAAVLDWIDAHGDSSEDASQGSYGA